MCYGTDCASIGVCCSVLDPWFVCSACLKSLYNDNENHSQVACSYDDLISVLGSLAPGAFDVSK